MYNKPCNSIVCLDKNVKYFSLLFKQKKKKKVKQKHTLPPSANQLPKKPYHHCNPLTVLVKYFLVHSFSHPDRSPNCCRDCKHMDCFSKH